MSNFQDRPQTFGDDLSFLCEGNPKLGYIKAVLDNKKGSNQNSNMIQCDHQIDSNIATRDFDKMN